MEFGRNRSHLPVFGVEEVTNPSDQLRPDHASPRVEKVNPADRPTTTDANREEVANMSPPRPVAPHKERRFRGEAHAGRKRAAGSTLIRHAGTPACPVDPLSIAMIEAPFRAPLVTPIGLPSLLGAGRLAARGLAVADPMVAGPTDPENS